MQRTSQNQRLMPPQVQNFPQNNYHRSLVQHPNYVPPTNAMVARPSPSQSGQKKSAAGNSASSGKLDNRAYANQANQNHLLVAQ